MTDIYDLASDLEQLQRDTAIEDARSHAPHGESAKFCAMPDCEVPIPEERRQAMPGCKLCLDCQTRVERYPKLRELYE